MTPVKKGKAKKKRTVRVLPPLSPRTKMAVVAGLTARTASRVVGRGAGGMIGGRLAQTVDPAVLEELTEGRRVVLVTGTNGKSTTTRLTVAALKRLGSVAANLGGDNMESGIITALMSDLQAPYAVLEVDEMNLPVVAAATKPEVIILINLSRDQLDRVGEIATVESRLREAVATNPQATIVANADDPLIVSAAWDARKVVWVAAGAPWQADAAAFPRTGTLVRQAQTVGPETGGRTAGDFDIAVRDWTVEGSHLYRRPVPDWWLTQDDRDPQGGDSNEFILHGQEGVRQRVKLRLPGQVNQGNAALALAAAVTLGAPLRRAAAAVKKVEGISGRYQTYDVGGRQVRLLLAKNPAGWQQSLLMVPADARQIVIAVNAEMADGVDTSWLWDVPFAELPHSDGTRIIASGQRVADLAVRLDYAGVDAEIIDDPWQAIQACSPGPVEVLANYTAFRDLKKELDRGGN